MNSYEMEHVTTITATVEMEPIGPVPDGLRLNGWITGGTFAGPKLNGKIRPVGADWLRIRPDGVGAVDVRCTYKTDDGVLIYVTYQGFVDLGSDGYNVMMSGQSPAEVVRIRCAAQLHCAHPDYQWVNRYQFLIIGEGEFDKLTVRHDLYMIS